MGSGESDRKSGARRPGSQPPTPFSRLQHGVAGGQPGHSYHPGGRGPVSRGLCWVLGPIPARPPPSPWLPGPGLWACPAPGDIRTLGPVTALPPPWPGPARAAHLPPNPPLPALCSETGVLVGGASEWPLRGLCWELRGDRALGLLSLGHRSGPQRVKERCGLCSGCSSACPQPVPNPFLMTDE